MRDERDRQRSNQVRIAALGSGILAAAIIITSIGDPSPLGSPEYWAWILTGLQVVALRTAASGRSWGWLLGACVQFPWIAYALVTAQLGFVPGCLVSGAVQAHSYLRCQDPHSHLRTATYA